MVFDKTYDPTLDSAAEEERRHREEERAREKKREEDEQRRRAIETTLDETQRQEKKESGESAKLTGKKKKKHRSRSKGMNGGSRFFSYSKSPFSTIVLVRMLKKSSFSAFESIFLLLHFQFWSSQKFPKP